MKSYKAKKRKKFATNLLMVFVVIIALGFGIFLLFPRGKEMSVLPTMTPNPTSTPKPSATPSPPTVTPYPPGNEWDLTQELQDWQIKILLEDLNKFWSIFMAPEEVIDCVGVLEIVQQKDPATRDGYAKLCAEYKKDGVFESGLPLEKLALVKTTTKPDQGLIGLQFDTTKEWPLEKRYITDNGLLGMYSVDRAIYNVYLVFEKGIWRLFSIYSYFEGEDF